MPMQTFNSEYLKNVSSFSGNPNDLNRNIAVCKAIKMHFMTIQIPHALKISVC